MVKDMCSPTECQTKVVLGHYGAIVPVRVLKVDMAGLVLSMTLCAQRNRAGEPCMALVIAMRPLNLEAVLR